MKLNQITISVSNEATFSVEFSENITPGKTVIYFECDELNKTVKELEAKGIKFFKQPANKPWLWREAYLRDPTGISSVHIMQAITG